MDMFNIMSKYSEGACVTSETRYYTEYGKAMNVPSGRDILLQLQNVYVPYTFVPDALLFICCGSGPLLSSMFLW